MHPYLFFFNFSCRCNNNGHHRHHPFALPFQKKEITGGTNFPSQLISKSVFALYIDNFFLQNIQVSCLVVLCALCTNYLLTTFQISTPSSLSPHLSFLPFIYLFIQIHLSICSVHTHKNVERTDAEQKDVKKERINTFKSLFILFGNNIDEDDGFGLVWE